MAGVKGRSGTNRNKEKPYAEALRMELLSAGDDHRRLRAIARKHIELAEAGDLQAIKELADRMDGKPAQEQTVHADHTVRYVARIPEKASDAETWQKQNAPTIMMQ